MLSVTAWADELQVSTSTENPEYIYKIHCGRQNQTKYWGNVGQPVDATSAAQFAFYAVTGSENQYYIYDITNKVYLCYANSSIASGPNQVSSTDKYDNTTTTDGTTTTAIGTKWQITTYTSGSVVYYRLQPVSSDGTVYSKYYANWHGGISSCSNSMGWFDGGDDGGSSWTFVFAGGTKAATITYNVSLEGSTDVLYTVDVQGAIGNSYPTPTLPSSTYCSSVYYSFNVPSGTVAETKETVSATLVQNLPFKISKSYEDAAWYTVGISSNKYKLYYTAGESPMKPSEASPTVTDKYMFCFVGDIVNGFKIYNKLAGADMLLSSSKNLSDGKDGNNTYVTMVEKATAEQQCYLWDILNKSEATNTVNFEGFMLAQHGTSSARMNFAQSSLAFWTKGSGGNSTFTIEKVLDVEELENMCDKAGSVGYPDASNTVVSELRDAFAAFMADGSTANTSALLTAITNYKACTDVVMPETGKFYTFQETTQGRYVMSTLAKTGNTDRLATSAKNTSSADCIFYYADGEYMMGYNDGYFVGETTSNNPFVGHAVAGSTTGSVFSFNSADASEGSLYVNFQDGSRRLYALDDGYTNAGGSSATGDGYRFFVTKVTELPLTIGSNGWSSFSAPVDVMIPEGVTVYYAKDEPNNGKLLLTKLEGDVIPAETGVLVSGTEGTTVYFDTYITGSTPELTGNKLVCNWYVNTIGNSSEETAKTDGLYAFATKANSETKAKTTGFMKLLTEITLLGHKCYLNTTTSAGSPEFLPITLTDDPTGIESAEATTVSDSDAPIYDLQGRKVNGTKKGGMYIQNGKVFIAM